MIFHLHVSYVSRSRGSSATYSAEYINRIGSSARRPDKVLASGSMHMPPWVEDELGMGYWKQADGTGTRANARLAYRVEFALPRGFELEALIRLVQRYGAALSALCVRGRAGCQVPISWAIHAGFGRNPHAHLLVSPAIADSLERAPKQWFRRAHPKDPQRGGTVKATWMGKRSWLIAIRQLWAEVGNTALAEAGRMPTLDHRSYRARGIDRPAGRHRGTGRADRPSLPVPLYPAMVKRDAVARPRPAPAPATKEANHLQLLEEAWHRAVIELRNAVEADFADPIQWLRARATFVARIDDENARRLNRERLDDTAWRGRLCGGIGPQWIRIDSGTVLWLVRADGHACRIAAQSILATVDDEGGLRLLRDVMKSVDLFNATIFVTPGLRYRFERAIEGLPGTRVVKREFGSLDVDSKRMGLRLGR